MSNGEKRNKRGLSVEYPDPRTPEQRGKDQRAACRQAGALVRQQKNESFVLETIRSLQRRRADRPDLVQFDAVRSGEGPGAGLTLVVRGEMLADAAAVQHEGTRVMLERLGFEWEPIECLEGRVVRLKNPDIDAERSVDVARLIRRGGTAAGVNHITPLGPIMKAGNGGAEPSDVRLKAPATRKPKQSVAVAVIDTGIADQRRSDGWLRSVARSDNVDLLDDLPTQDGFLDAGAGHGTFAAGIVQQVAPGADLRVYKAIDSDGIGSEVGVACAMLRAVSDGAQILNLSLGVQTVDDLPPLAIAAALELINERTQGEVVVIAAAGNDGNRRPSWPAAFRGVVSVAGLTADLTPSDWSNRGFWVTCSTVGEGVLSTYPQGTESSDIDPQPDSFPADAWAVWTGTSFAAPQIAGAVARDAAAKKISPRQALGQLLSSGTPIPEFGIAVPVLPGA